MKRRLLCGCLSLMLALVCCVPALADAGLLDAALSRWLDAQPSVRFSARLELTAWQPFPEDTLAMLNGALQHVAIDASVARNGEESATAVRLDVGEESLFTLAERENVGGSELETSLLPNRVLTLASGSALETLAGEEGGEALPFTLLTAIDEAGAAYGALMEAMAPYAEEKKANYKIKSIGTAKWSKTARLTVEQSDGALSELRAMLGSGMDAAYREELSQVTFAKGFVVALYQNADKQDMAVYMKGSLVYPDGSTRKLAYQWAFTGGDEQRVDTYKYESTGGKPSDNRVIAASVTRKTLDAKYALDARTETTVKRDGVTNVYTVTADLSGKAGNAETTCVGTVSQTVQRTESGDSTTNAESAAVDLAIAPDADGALLTGTADYERKRDKIVQTGLHIVFDKAESMAATVAPEPESTENAPTIQIISAAGETREPSEQDAAAPTPAPMETEFLVGEAPTGLTGLQTPSELTTVALDEITAERMNALTAEISQRLAAKLLLAVSKLPDIALLKDGMTDTDYAAFLALLGNR